MATKTVDLGPVIGPQGPAGEVDPTTKIPFSTPSTDTDMVSGDQINTLFGKIKKRFSVILDKIGDLTTLSTTAKGSTVAAINELNNNLNGKSDKMHNHDGVYFKKTGGTISGNVVVSGTINDNRGKLVSAGASNSVAIVWSSAMRFDVYVDNTFVGTLTPVK